jgi:hypothetical protein
MRFASSSRFSHLRSSPVQSSHLRPAHLLHTLRGSARAAAVLLALALGSAPAWAQEPDRYAISGDDVAIYNLAGEVRLEAAMGSAVVVEVSRGGKDAERLRVESGRIEGRQTLRVLYPGDRVIYPNLGRGSASQVRVREDGTFYGERNRSGRLVSVGGSGFDLTRGGIEAYADLTVRVPTGQRLALYLAAGKVEVRNVEGELVVGVGVAPIETRGTRGSLRLDTGSGRISVEDAEGAVVLDTGSGNIEVHRVRGPSLLVDTGSGSVTGSAIEVEKLDVDTGSGRISLADVWAAEIRLDTGSGSVDFELRNEAVRRLIIDTGSGGVRLALPQAIDARLEVDTGSGGIEVDLPLRLIEKARSRVVGEFGSGSGLIRVDTGSGGVRIRGLGVVAVSSAAPRASR